VPVTQFPGFLSPFRLSAFASWVILRPLGSSTFLTVGLPAVDPPDPNGVVVLHMSKTRPGRARPDALLVDVNCWGALSVADAGDTPWACFSPYTPALQSPGVPPFGLGLAPLPGVLGRIRDAVLRPIAIGMMEWAVLPAGNKIRASAGAPPVASADEFMRRAPLILVASGKPFEYPQTDWGDAVQMIGP